LFIGASAESKKPITIAVIDTGFGWLYNKKFPTAKLCKYGHKDFTKEFVYMRPDYTVHDVPIDTHGHGTNIVGVIQQQIKDPNKDYCLVIIKYYTVHQSGSQNLEAALNAFKYATNIKADIINFSGGGPEFSKLEFNIIKKFTDQGGIFVTAAGNDNQNIDVKETAYYPASYSLPIVVVGNNNFYGKKSKTSNYGNRVNRWEVGENVTAYGLTMTGTSQATAVATGKIVANMKK